MADLATTSFLNELKSVYPYPAALASTPAETVIENPWYLIAAVAFSASNKAAAVSAVFEFVLNELKLAQLTVKDAEQVSAQRLLLARRFREGLLQSGMLSGMPRLYRAERGPDDLRDTEIMRNTKTTTEEYARSGRQLFESVYRETADPVQSLLDVASPDLGWWCNTVGYGITYGGTTLLTQVETSYLIVAALIAVDAPRQIGWHLANAKNGGATQEQAKAVRQIAMTVAEKAGITWEAGVPEVV